MLLNSLYSPEVMGHLKDGTLCYFWRMLKQHGGCIKFVFSFRRNDREYRINAVSFALKQSGLTSFRRYMKVVPKRKHHSMKMYGGVKVQAHIFLSLTGDAGQ
jgi:hypothetical protein